MAASYPRDLSEFITSRSLRRLLLILFFGSGCAALIYEIVWFQFLQLLLGSSAVSLAVVLGTYMGGMCLGSLILPRVISARRHPLRVYAMLEAGIGIAGLVILFGLPQAARFYSAHAASGLPGILFRGVIAASCMLLPTMMMGATLPTIARWIETTPRGVSWLGFFYTGNLAGAVFGCLLAGFYLLRLYDTVSATYFAAALNGFVALVAYVLSAVVPSEVQFETQEFQRNLETPVIGSELKGFSPVHFAVALSGLTALGAEVVWTRLLSLMLGGTVYTFSIILAVFLLGLGIGSQLGSLLARRSLRPALALGWCQLLLTCAVAWTAYMLAQSLPYWPVDPSLSLNPWLNAQLSLSRCLWALLPATVLWGASFPLALAALAVRGRDPARFVGGVYAMNTLGGIIGGIGFSLILLPRAGTQQCQRVLIVLSAVSALLAFAPLMREWLRRWSGMTVFRAAATLSALILIPVLCARSVSKTPGELVAYGRYMPSLLNKSHILFVGEGMNSSVAISQLWKSDVRVFHVSGKAEASSYPQDMRLQRMLGHLPALLHPQPRSVLIVGCGAGVTAGSFTLHPDIESIVLCELEPLVPKVASEYFGAENNHVITDPRTRVIYDDARHYILTTHDKFDVITSDPIHPWVKGSAALYTKEYFDLVKAHLKPGGMVTQWVPLYESNSDVVKSEIATFFEVFPKGTIWSNDQNGKGYDVLLLGQVGEARIDLDEIDRRLAQPEYAAVARSLREIGFKSGTSLFAQYAGRAQDLAPWLNDAQISCDLNLRLQYLAGLSLNLYLSDGIYAEMLSYRKFPDTLFFGSSQRREAVKRAFTDANLKRTRGHTVSLEAETEYNGLD